MTFVRFAAAFTVAMAVWVPMAEAGFKRIKTEDQFLAQLAGHRMMDEDGNWASAGPDGDISGALADGTRIKGKWIWANRMYCRTIVIGRNKPVTDCLALRLDGDAIEFRRNNGKGDRQRAQLVRK